MKEQLRQLAINLLDDQHGISENAYGALMDTLSIADVECADIMKCAEAADGRFFLPENHTLTA